MIFRVPDTLWTFTQHMNLEDKNFTEFGYSRQIIKYGRWLANVISTLWISGKSGTWDFWTFISTIWETVYAGQRASLLVWYWLFWLHLLKNGLCEATSVSILCMRLSIDITIIDSFDYTYWKTVYAGQQALKYCVCHYTIPEYYINLTISRIGYGSSELSQAKLSW